MKKTFLFKSRVIWNGVKSVFYNEKCFYILSRLDNFYVSNYRKTRNLFLEYFQTCFSDFKKYFKKISIIRNIKNNF